VGSYLCCLARRSISSAERKREARGKSLLRHYGWMRIPFVGEAGGQQSMTTPHPPVKNVSEAVPPSRIRRRRTYSRRRRFCGKRTNISSGSVKRPPDPLRKVIAEQKQQQQQQKKRYVEPTRESPPYIDDQTATHTKPRKEQAIPQVFPPPPPPHPQPTKTNSTHPTHPQSCASSSTAPVDADTRAKPSPAARRTPAEASLASAAPTASDRRGDNRTVASRARAIATEAGPTSPGPSVRVAPGRCFSGACSMR
jgi:hypothetical protein